MYNYPKERVLDRRHTAVLVIPNVLTNAKARGTFFWSMLSSVSTLIINHSSLYLSEHLSHCFLCSRMRPRILVFSRGLKAVFIHEGCNKSLYFRNQNSLWSFDNISSNICINPMLLRGKLYILGL